MSREDSLPSLNCLLRMLSPCFLTFFFFFFLQVALCFYGVKGNQVVGWGGKGLFQIRRGPVELGWGSEIGKGRAGSTVYLKGPEET